MPREARRFPAPVVAYAIVNLAYVTVALALSTSLWQNHPLGVGVSLLFLSWLAAIVLWRRRWAWMLMLLWATSIVIAPIWGGWNGDVPYAVSVLSLSLLLSPGMLRWVHVTRASRPRAT